MGDTALSRSSSIPRPAVGVTESDERRLRRYNAVMGGMHLAQAIAILVLSSDATLPVTTSFLQEAPTPEYVPPTVNEFDLRLGPAVAIFSFLSAIAHFTLVLPGVFGWYVANL